MRAAFWAWMGVIADGSPPERPPNVHVEATTAGDPSSPMRVTAPATTTAITEMETTHRRHLWNLGRECRLLVGTGQLLQSMARRGGRANMKFPISLGVRRVGCPGAQVRGHRPVSVRLEVCVLTSTMRQPRPCDQRLSRPCCRILGG